MKAQKLIRFITMTTAFLLLFGPEKRIATAQFMNGKSDDRTQMEKNNHKPMHSHLEETNQRRIQSNQEINQRLNRDVILSIDKEYNFSSFRTLFRDTVSDVIFDKSTPITVNIKPPKERQQIFRSFASTNYSIISRGGKNGGGAGNCGGAGVLFTRRGNHTADARLQSEANVINQSAVLHLDVRDYDNSDSGDYKAGGGENDDAVEFGGGVVEAPGTAVNTNAATNDSDHWRAISADDGQANSDGGGGDVGDGGGEDNLSMAWWVQLLWTAVFVIMIVTAIGGNCIVMWIVIAHKRMRTVTNYFLVNLSCADLLLSTLNCFFNFIYMLQGNWQFGGWYCTVNNFIANTTVAASVFTLTAMCCDRYFAIVHPLHPRMSRVTAIVVIVLIWCFSMALAAPCLFFSTTVSYRSDKAERIACILIWPDGQPTDSQMDFSYQVLFLVITYVVPMVLMSFFYTSIGMVLWGSQSIGERTQMQLDAIKSKRKVVKMIIFIVLLFAICWLPYHAYFIYTHFDRNILYTKYVQHVYLAFYWFAMANAMVNPLIYYWMNAKFRGYFRRAICCWRPHDPDFDAHLNGRTIKSTRCEDEETRISLRQLKHSNTQSTNMGSRSKHSR